LPSEFAVKALAILPNNNLISVAHNQLTIWNTTTWTVHQKLTTSHTRKINAIAILRNGKQIASGSDDKTIKIHDISNGALKSSLEGHLEAIKCLTVIPNSNYLASGSDTTMFIGNKPVIIIWDLIKHIQVKQLFGHNNDIEGLAVLPNGNLISASDDKTIKIWNLKDRDNSDNWHLLKDWRAHQGDVETIKVFESNSFIISGGADREIKIWNKDYEIAHVLREHTSEVQCICVISESDFILASGSHDTTIKIWNITTGHAIHTLVGHSKSVQDLVVLNDKYLISGSDDMSIKIWEL